MLMLFLGPFASTPLVANRFTWLLEALKHYIATHLAQMLHHMDSHLAHLAIRIPPHLQQRLHQLPLQPLILSKPADSLRRKPRQISFLASLLTTLPGWLANTKTLRYNELPSLPIRPTTDRNTPSTSRLSPSCSIKSGWCSTIKIIVSTSTMRIPRCSS
jgi:hypothetical protein